MKIGALIGPIGILSFLLLLVVAISGLLRVKIQNHKLLAVLAIGLATLHALLILSRRYF